MMIPVRCFSCGKAISSAYEDFKKRVDKGEEPKKVLDSLNLDKYCCRRMLISHVEIIDDLLKFYEKREHPALTKHITPTSG